MKTKIFRRSVYLLPILVLLACLGISLKPATSSADPTTPTTTAAEGPITTGTWQDHNTITLGGDTYFNTTETTQINGNTVESDPDPRIFSDQNTDNTCTASVTSEGLTAGATIPDNLAVKAGNLSVAVYTSAASDANSTCSEQTITLTNASLANVYFVPSADGSSFTTSDGRRTYSPNANGSEYIEVADQETNGQGCQDSLTVASPSSSTATLVIRSSKPGKLTPLEDGPGEVISYPPTVWGNAGTSNPVNGCYEFTVKVNVIPLNDSNPHGAQTQAGSSSTQATCESSGFALSWIICAGVNLLAKAVDGIYSDFIQPLLQVSPLQSRQADGSFAPIYLAWSSFRIYGDIFLIIALLVIVFGESIGGGLVDSYTAKKVLPRLLIAAVLINLSFYIVAIMVDLTNIVGDGLKNILTAPFHVSGSFSLNVSVGSSVTTLGLAALTVFALHGIGGAVLGVLVPFVLLPAVLIFIAILFTILIRQALIILLVVVSPVAFALYCLPNTEQYFRRWWTMLFKTLLVYPIIAVLFALGNIMSVVIGSLTSNGVLEGVSVILTIIAMLSPLILIPFAFQIAGDVLGKLHDTFTNYGKRAHQGMLGNPNNPLSWRNTSKRHLAEAATRREYGAIRAGDAGGASWLQRSRGRAVKAFDRNINSRISRYTAEAQKREDEESNTGYDGYRYQSIWQAVAAGEAAPGDLVDFDGNAIAAGSVSDQDRYFDAKGRQIHRATALDSERQHGSSEHDTGRNLEYTLRKAQTDGDLANFRRAFASTARRKGWNQVEIGDAWARSTFEHKDKFASEWFSSPQLQPDGSIRWNDVADNTVEGRAAQNRMVSEKHKTVESFRLSSIRDADWRSWNERRNRIQAHLDTGGTLTQEDAKFFAESDELLDTVSHSPNVTFADDGTPQVGGTSAAAKGVIESLLKNRRYRSAQHEEGTAPSGSPLYSVNQRVIYNHDMALDPTGKRLTGSQLDDAAQALAVPIAPAAAGGPANTVAVTGAESRPTIPRQF